MIKERVTQIFRRWYLFFLILLLRKSKWKWKRKVQTWPPLKYKNFWSMDFQHQSHKYLLNVCLCFKRQRWNLKAKNIYIKKWFSSAVLYLNLNVHDASLKPVLNFFWMAVINSLVYTSFFNCLHESSRNFFLFLSSMANTGITLLLLYRLTSWALAKERNPRIAWKSWGRRFMGKTLLCSFLGTTAFGTLTLQIYRTFKMSFHLNGFNILQITQFVSNWCFAPLLTMLSSL